MHHLPVSALLLQELQQKSRQEHEQHWEASQLLTYH
jgi:hypothetical protein